ncbi:MAG: isochorismatase family protein [Ignavibacteria bacterium]|nr:isochorismatase family protein [Ignavibacteria bacterium]
MKRHPKILQKDKTGLLVIDIQERILNVMMKHETLVANVNKLIGGFKILQLPIYFTEQYPKGLGPTTESILPNLQPVEAVQKLTFSCSGADGLFQKIRNDKLEQIVVCGIESHVCVMQTVLDLLASGFQVNVPIDSISSRKEADYQAALMRFQSEGAIITSTEAVLFELLEECRSDEFKQISKLVK